MCESRSCVKKMTLPRSLFVLYGLTLFIHYCRFGATEIKIQYSLFLIMSTITGLGVLFLARGEKMGWKALLLGAIGLILLGQIAWRGPVTGNGYLYAWLGWSALFLTLLLLNSGIRVQSFIVLLILLGVFEALYGLLQSLGGFDYIGQYFREVGRTATGTLINRNHFAGLMNMVIPLALGALYAGFLRKRRKGQSISELTAQMWILLLGLSVLGLAIVLSLSRGGVLTLIATQAFLGFLLFLSWRKRKGGVRGLFPAVTVALLLIVTVYGVGAGLDPLLDRFEEAESGWEGRAQLYRDTLDLIGKHPIVGVGPGMYRWRIQPHLTGKPADFHHAHNDYLEYAADWGVPLALFFWGLVIWRVFACCGRFLRSNDPWTRGIALGCAAAIFSILVHSLVDFNLQVGANWMLFCTILGISFLPAPAGGLAVADRGPSRFPSLAEGK